MSRVALEIRVALKFHFTIVLCNSFRFPLSESKQRKYMVKHFITRIESQMFRINIHCHNAQYLHNTDEKLFFRTFLTAAAAVK